MSEINRQPQSNPDLVQYTNDELLDEIMSRFDASIFCGQSNRSESLEAFHRRYYGRSLECYGLAGHMQSLTMQAFSSSCHDAEE